MASRIDFFTSPNFLISIFQTNTLAIEQSRSESVLGKSELLSGRMKFTRKQSYKTVSSFDESVY